MKTILVACLLAGCMLSIVTAQHDYDHPCGVRPITGPPHNGEKFAVSLPECQNGTIWWGIPRGSLQVNFQFGTGQTSFIVCFPQDIYNKLTNVYDVINTNAIARAGPGELECSGLSNSAGLVTVRFTGDADAAWFMAVIPYYIIIQ